MGLIRERYRFSPRRFWALRQGVRGVMDERGRHHRGRWRRAFPLCVQRVQTTEAAGAKGQYVGDRMAELV